MFSIYLRLEVRQREREMDGWMERQMDDCMWEKHGSCSTQSKYQVVQVTTTREIINKVYFLHGQILEVITGAKYFGDDISNGL